MVKLLGQAVLLVSLSLLLFFHSSCGRRAPEYEEVFVDDSLIRLPLSRVYDRDVHFFTFKVDGRNVNFFVRTDGRGHLQTHFDACYSCFKYKLGYVHEGDQVVCLACRIGYKLEEEVWDYVGACVPISLKSRIAEPFLVLDVDWVKKGARYF